MRLRAARRLPRGLGLDAALAQLLGEGLAPAVQVGLARVQALAVLRLGAHADVHVRVGLVVVQHHHVLVVGQLGLARTRAPPTARVSGSVPRGIDSMMLKASRRSLDVLDQAAAEAPVVGQLAQRVLAAHRLAALVLDLEPAVLADVAEVRGDGLHAAPAARHLDHHLRRPAHDGGLDALADGRGTLARRQRR